MKYILKLELEKPVIRSDYRRTIISFFKKSISSYMDGYFYEELYLSGAKKKSPAFRPQWIGNGVTDAGTVVRKE